MDRTQAIQKLALRCRYDLFFLAKHILGYDLMEEEVHGDLCKYTESLLPSRPPEWKPPLETSGEGLEDQYKNGNTNLLLLMPRGTFKSSVVTIGFSLQYILNDPNARILIDSETFTKAKAFLSEIKDHLETNEAYREVFKSIHGMYPDAGKKKEMLWTDSQVKLACRSKPQKEPTFMVAGIDKTINGMHYDLIIMDDLHSEKNVTNKEQIQQVIDHWKYAYSLLDPGKPLIVIGTRWHYLDLYNHILKYERERFNIMVRRAVLADGSLLFPSRLSQQVLDDIKATQGTYIFSCQYLNEPADNENAVFKASYIVRTPWELVDKRPINWYLAVDPSYEGPYSDYAALVVAGMDFQRDLYVRHILRMKMTYSDIIRNMFDLYNRYQPKLVILETIGTQKSIMYELANEQKRRNTWIPLREISGSNKPKEERIRGLAPFYENGHAVHIVGANQIEDLEYELLQFPVGEHDDIVDALARVLEFASPPNAPHSIMDEDDKPIRRVDYKPRSIITGV